MRKRKPRAFDRDLVEYLNGLPDGRHIIVVEPDGFGPVIKAEGGISIGLANNRRLMVIPDLKSLRSYP